MRAKDPENRAKLMAKCVHPQFTVSKVGGAKSDSTADCITIQENPCFFAFKTSRFSCVSYSMDGFQDTWDVRIDIYLSASILVILRYSHKGGEQCGSIVLRHGDILRSLFRGNDDSSCGTRCDLDLRTNVEKAAPGGDLNVFTNCLTSIFIDIHSVLHDAFRFLWTHFFPDTG